MFPAFNAYAVMGWLPAILTGAGITPRGAAAMLSATALIALPLSFALARLATRNRDQRPHVIGIVLGGVARYVGLLLAPVAAPWLWVVLLSCLHGGFPLAMTLISLRTREPSTATGCPASCRAAAMPWRRSARWRSVRSTT